MKLSKFRDENGKYNVECINVMEITVTEREFAALVGISPAMVNRLKKMGVLRPDVEKKLPLIENLKLYRLYLPLERRADYDQRIADFVK